MLVTSATWEGNCVFKLLLKVTQDTLEIAQGISRICENNATTQIKVHFTGHKILILKHKYLDCCNKHTYCPLAVSFAGRNMSFLLQHRPKNRQSHVCHNLNFPFLSYDAVVAYARILPLFSWRYLTFVIKKIYLKNSYLKIVTSVIGH